MSPSEGIPYANRLVLLLSSLELLDSTCDERNDILQRARLLLLWLRGREGHVDAAKRIDSLVDAVVIKANKIRIEIKAS